ncbi:hypothetical protein O3M35_004115 [Rhynocoris fuscipes]|uniref:Reverse transcriptase domain-containing protein n=1 Tax=Rhynocoris fuscipes TaxID=488301 RepID=A0AAW1CKT4_9HEMI
MSHNIINVAHINAQSLVGHFVDFSNYFVSNFFHIIGISESWLKPSVSSGEISLPNYNIFRCDRIRCNGGGVCIYVHNSLIAKIVTSSAISQSNSLLEYLILDINGPKGKLLYCLFYRPPKVAFTSDFSTILYNYCTSYKNVIIAGDLNVDLLSNSSDQQFLTNTIISLNYHLVPYNATHHTAASHTWLDVHIVVRLPDNSQSSFLPISTGVPQGSSLSPLLYSIYVHSLPLTISHCNYHFYADDLLLYHSFSPSELTDSFTIVNKDISNIDSWTKHNNLLLNTMKTKAIIFGTRRYITQLTDLPDLFLNSSPIPFVSSIKYLGVTLDSTLSYSQHIQSISKKSFSTLHQLKRFSNSLDLPTKKLLVTSLILPNFDYCSLVYDTITDELNTKLYRTLNAAIRFIFKLPIDSRITPYYSKLSLLKPSYRRQFLMISFLYHVLRNKSPSYIYHLFQFKSSPYIAIRSNPLDLCLPFHRTVSYQKSFTIKSIKLWNSLPSEIRQSSPTSFKSRLTSFLFNKQSLD